MEEVVRVGSRAVWTRHVAWEVSRCGCQGQGASGPQMQACQFLGVGERCVGEAGAPGISTVLTSLVPCLLCSLTSWNGDPPCSGGSQQLLSSWVPCLMSSILQKKPELVLEAQYQIPKKKDVIIGPSAPQGGDTADHIGFVRLCRCGKLWSVTVMVSWKAGRLQRGFKGDSLGVQEEGRGKARCAA